MIQIDMEMPKTCGQCLCAMKDYDYNTARCRLKYDLCFEANSRDYSNRRLDGCPLHEVTADPDTVSRQAVYDTLTEYYHHSTDIQHKALAEAISRVPPSQSRPHGKWLPEYGDPSAHAHYCSVCKFYYTTYPEEMNYCPHCGAKMEQK